MDAYDYEAGYVASLIDCQGALVRALNTAMNALGEAGNPTAAHAARVSRDEALALLARFSPQAVSENGNVQGGRDARPARET